MACKLAGITANRLRRRKPPRPRAPALLRHRTLRIRSTIRRLRVTFIQFRNILAPSITGANGVANSLQMQPVLPIGPFHSFPLVQLVKITMPLYEAIPGTVNLQRLGVTGVGDLQVFDLLTIKQSWGRWGFGPALVFPTASSNGTGRGQIPDRSIGRADLYRHQEPYRRRGRPEPDLLRGRS